MKHTMRRTHIFLTQLQRQALEALAQATGLSMAEHIRRAIDEYLERKTNQKK